MFQRLTHHVLLTLVSALLFLPNLGVPSLWDIDEGNNAEAAREMLASDNWVVPTFNGKLRVDKPALLYWLQIGAYRAFGVNEFAARLPSALAAWLTVLLAYELGRRQFGAAAGLLAGLVLASNAAFCAAAHFANPDALLNLCTVLTLLFFWHGVSRPGRLWFGAMGIAAGLAVLAKGPVGLVLPSAVSLLYLLCTGQVRRLLDPFLGLGVLAFVLVTAPWYAMVGVDTKAEFLRGFFWTHNVGRFFAPMENHHGPLYYYAVVLGLGFLPWSVFLGLSAWYSVRGWKHETPADAGEQPGELHAYALIVSRADLFLWCWVAVYFGFFSLAGTKLPNYVLPAYAPVAILTAHFLDRWRRGVLQPPAWVVSGSLVCLALAGVGLATGVLAAGGAVAVPGLHSRALPLPGLAAWAGLGAVPVLTAAIAGVCLLRQSRGAALGVLATAAVVFTGVLAAWGGAAVEAHKAPRPLAQLIQTEQTEPDIRVGCYQYFQPSLVFYCGRQVQQLDDTQEAVDLLRYPVPAYLVVPVPVWENELKVRIHEPYRLLGRHRDLYRGCEVVVVTNR